MNYIRGAVSAISAPYHYYKDLPPLNPSTLTGAIDVIVIQRPADDGDTELVCSPFHVRFGKWQVLRPGEKKVNVSVNGQPIPFNMKIGEAGEAFFVFETDDDVPDDLITSPILHPTNPEESGGHDAGAYPDRFGVRQDSDEKKDIESHQEGRLHIKNEDEIRRENPDTQEPDFLDLNAPPSPPHDDNDDSSKNANTTPKQTYTRPAIIRRPSHISISQPEQAFPSPPPTPGNVHTPEMIAQDKLVDAALNAAGKRLHVPDVEYHRDIALDIEGYHSHNRERSDRTVRSSEGYEFPSGSKTRSTTPSPVRNVSHTQSMDSSSEGLHIFPSFRATSEPPPDMEEHELQSPSRHNKQPSSSSKLNILTPVQEYSWEWGAFPQPSPMKTSFGKGGRIDGSLGRSWGKGKGKSSIEFSGVPPALYEDENTEMEEEHGRSRSVPPELDGSPSRDRKGRDLPEEYEEPNLGDLGGDEEEISDEESEFADFGKGGKLTTTSADPTTFVLSIEGKEATFELSLVSTGEGDTSITQTTESDPEDGEHSAQVRGRKNRYGGVGAPKIVDGLYESGMAGLFDVGRVDFHRFLNDDDLVNDPRLVIRWAGDQYITRKDSSPLMYALVGWRNAALQHRITSRPISLSFENHLEGAASSSPPSTEENEQASDRIHHTRSKSEPPEKLPGKPTSSSWVQWWSRSRQITPSIAPSSDVERDKALETTISRNERPVLRGTASAPLQNGAAPPSSRAQYSDTETGSRVIPAADSAPALPSTPVQGPVTTVPSATPVPKIPRGRKFAKTLRLTSDQLKALNLKPGANTITFSLSASGAIACTARIFVWDSTDLVVISDIDGTITKSDGLGHVFAMIGRDWTHLGVAKLYTDIARNGYKIMYLTSRAIGQADATRDYLRGIKQNDYQLPEGPVIMSPDRLMASLHREVIMRKPEVFKMACLRDIQRLFGEASRNPFSAGFGNRITDALSYRSVNVPSARIFTIDSSGEVKMELLELAGYKSSYIHMTDLVDQMFPPIHRKWTPEFTDFNYWKPPVQDYPLPDLSPPSPALSARSDTSNQSALTRLRNFSLVGSRQGTMQTSYTKDPYSGSENSRSSHLRQISSFEKLSNTLGFAQTSSTNGDRRSTSPESQSSGAYDSEDDDDDPEIGADGRRRKRERRRSMTSMPGTLDEMHFGMDDEDDNYEDNYNDNYGDGEDEDLEDNMIEGDGDAGDEAFDEDLLAAGEMKNVPFL
ncbi:Lipin/Ned1/Smp2-domain-containing protein [Collybia nuda]|uniref:phosphatidate phosphatase n=1 Tax=Collybia nuda TaxID=64659 RepID=A0A9P5Y8W1_9AGAR|nr:Lipin/Ned1/Smp2-domain-containing protein [Collybia nuda]